MDKSRANISQIQKYLNGELDAKAMHQLEREAQRDPFLMDALEGYEMAGADQQPNLDILTKQLSQRTSKKERRIIPWTTVSVAAGVLGFMIVVGLLYRGNNTTEQLKTAQANMAQAPKVDTLVPPVIVQPNKNDVATLQPNKNALVSPVKGKQYDYNTQVAAKKATAAEQTPLALAEIAIPNSSPTVKNDSTPLDEMVIGAITQDKAISHKKDSVEMPLTVAITKRPISQPLLGKADGVTTSDIRRQAGNYELSKLNLPAGYLSGVVVNTTNGLPVAGVNVQLDGKSTGTLTDDKGNFSLPAASSNETVNLSYSGFNSQKVNVNTNASQYKVVLNSNVTLNKSNTYGYVGSANTTTDLSLAHPQKGWILYQLYLGQKGYLPAGEKPGVVELKFTVSATGELSNITVVKGLSKATDKKAVSLVANGPKWVGNANGKDEEKTLQVEFSIKK